MGLDISVREFVMIPENIITEKELEEYCNSNEIYWIEVEDNVTDPILKKYMKTLPMSCDDWETTFNELGLNFDDYEWVECGENVVFAPKGIKEDDPKFNDKLLIISYDKIKYKLVPTNVVMYSSVELGYQRKGANDKFYEDDKWNPSHLITTEKELLDDWNKYFSDEDNAYYGKEAREHFKKNIIDNFEEGRTFVIYW